MPFGKEEFLRYKLLPGDILLNEGQSLELVGRSAIYKGDPPDCAFQNTLIRFKAGPDIETDFAAQLFRRLQVSGAFANIATKTTSIAHLGVTRLSDLLVLVPPLPEQRKIAAILSAIDETTEKTTVVIDQLQDVRKAMMQELLARGVPGRHTKFRATEIGEIPESWKVVRLGDAAEFVTSGSRGWAQYYSKTGSPFLRIGNLRRTSVYLDLKDVQLVEIPAGLGEAERTRAKAGDILISITADLGRVAVVHETLGDAHVSQHIALARLRPDYADPWFTGWFLSSRQGQKQFDLLDDKGTKAGLSLPSVSRVLLSLPPLREQTEIAAVFGSIHTRQEAEESQLAGLRQLKQALLHALLAGEVRVSPDEAIV